MKKVLSLLTALFFIIGMQSCKEESPSEPVNHSPKIESISANPPSINTSDETILSCIATDEDGDALTITWTSATGSFPEGNVGASVKWIAPSTNGSFDIKATANDGKLTNTDSVKVEVIEIPIPEVPVLLFPVSGAVNIELLPIFSWNPSDGSISYALEISSDSLFSTLLFNQSGLTETSIQITITLNYLTQYYWRVRGENTSGTSAWSVFRRFSTKPFECGLEFLYSGKWYPTVQIESQCWFQENLAVGTMIQGTSEQQNGNGIEKYCYNNDPNNCDTYGGLYQWDEAMQYSNLSGAQGICPDGWHIPTYAEFQTLKDAVNSNGNALKAVGQGTGNGAGTNTSGFSALFAGCRYHYTTFASLGINTYFWTSAYIDITNAYAVALPSDASNIWLYPDIQNNGFSVRCIKD